MDPGFKYGSPTDTAHSNLINNILTAVNNKLLVSSIFCDLQKAFDCINHDILSKKWDFMISQEAYNLITSYLQQKYKKVLIDLDS
jgi:hypothetical protein